MMRFITLVLLFVFGSAISAFAQEFTVDDEISIIAKGAKVDSLLNAKRIQFDYDSFGETVPSLLIKSVPRYGIKGESEIKFTKPDKVEGIYWEVIHNKNISAAYRKIKNDFKKRFGQPQRSFSGDLLYEKDHISALVICTRTALTIVLSPR